MRSSLAITKNGEGVGIGLITEVMDYAPRTTASEWRALVILAEDANDTTRLTWSTVQGEKIAGRIGLSQQAWANLRTALVRKGLLEIAEAGARGHSAKYRFPDYRKNLHRSDEESEAIPHGSDEDSGEILHQIDEDHERMPHETDEESAGIFTDPMKNRPESSSVSLPLLLRDSSKASPLSPAAAIVRAARVVAEAEERDFEAWIIKTHVPRGLGWWHTTARNGDLAILATAWRATRTPPRPRGRCDFHLLPLPCIGCDADAKAVEQEGPGS